MHPSDHAVIIIGAGMSGLLAGIRLKQRGIDDFVILEKSGDVGGTWLDNAYPGSGCDVPSHLYSYSFAPNPHWSRMFARQPEILDYFRRQAEAYAIDTHLSLNTEIARATYDEGADRWIAMDRLGRIWRAPALIVATGQLNRPITPDIPGRESFAGAQFHSARWDASLDLAGKRVGIVGTGASAIQIVPEIAPQVGHLTLFQRSPHWIIPRNDAPFSERTKKLFETLPLLRRGLRAMIYRRLEKVWPAIATPSGKKAREMEQGARDHLTAHVPDPGLRAALTPDFPIGCKRTLVSDDYFPALTRANVDLETRGIASVTREGISLSDGTEVALDVLVWATGFDTHGFVAPIEIVGPEGTLADRWTAGPVAYRGTTVAGFPNLFLLYGPNTNLGHNSIIFMVEQQVTYALPAIERLARGTASRITVKARAQRDFNANLQAGLASSAWAGNCGSWYKTKSGIMPNNWYGDTRDFAKMMRKFDEDAYEIS